MFVACISICADCKKAGRLITHKRWRLSPQGPAAVSAGLQRPPARMIRSSLLSWLGAQEAAFAQKVAHILSVSPRWISRWINVNFVIRHKGLNNQTFLSQEPKKDDETFVFAKDFKSSFIFLFQESEKKGCYMGKIYFQFELFQWGKKSDFHCQQLKKTIISAVADDVCDLHKWLQNHLASPLKSD